MERSARDERIAGNESRFRDINERLEADLRSLPDEDREAFPFVCECGLLDCRDVVRLTLAEYEGIRGDPLQFAVLPGHEIANVEDVLRRDERFWLIRKHERSRPVVERTDRRQP